MTIYLIGLDLKCQRLQLQILVLEFELNSLIIAHLNRCQLSYCLVTQRLHNHSAGVSQYVSSLSRKYFIVAGLLGPGFFFPSFALEHVVGDDHDEVGDIDDTKQSEKPKNPTI